jgi:hypothetical protein
VTHKCPLNRSTIKSGKIFTGCDICLPSQLQKGDTAAGNRRYQQAQYRKDLVQPNMPRDFIKAFPDIAREKYDEETYRKFS